MNTWSIEDIYPSSLRQCTGDSAFLKPQDAPSTHCTGDVGFNQFLLESLMLRRWQATTWNYPVPVVVVPSVVMHCFKEMLGKPVFSVATKNLMAQIENFWDYIKMKFYLPERGYKPIIVVHMSWANDVRLIQTLVLKLIKLKPDDFVNVSV